MKRIAVLDDYQDIARSMPGWDSLADRATIAVFRDTLTSLDALAERLEPYEILVPIRERTRFTKALLERLPRLELLALAGRNTGQVDIETATARRVLVTESEGSGAGAVELTMGLIIAAVRRIPFEDRAIREGRWQTGLGVELAGKTLGIVGLGRIGRRIAAFGILLGMRVLAWGPTLTAERAAASQATYVPLDQVLAESDVVSLHLRLSDGTRGVIGARELALLKPTAYLVNTARGPLVDEEALVTALRERRFAGAALDVFHHEPIPPEHPLLALDNVVLTPHVGFVTQETYRSFYGQAAESITDHLSGRTPARLLNPMAQGQPRR
ncbi:MAG TPA: D-2-hydroxyacid dehydrogenase family protein [Candidatus Methylomirabilis sp.]|nr:D-2-hydroxyacid dehydrogenase family protein [Candidatus Methylomirabilis sp.]